MPGFGLADARSLLLAEDELQGAVAVGLGRLDLGDTVVGNVEHGDRDRITVVGEDPHHSHLAAEQAEALIDIRRRRRGRGHECSPATRMRPLLHYPASIGRADEAFALFDLSALVFARPEPRLRKSRKSLRL